MTAGTQPALAIVDGSCGSAHNVKYAEAPATGLCAAGSASTVTGIGPWFWTCASPDGGSDAACNATQAGGTVHRSGDGGATWTPGITGLAFNNQVNAMQPSPAYCTDRTLFAAAYHGFFKSTDGGDSWTQLTWAFGATSLAVSPAFATDMTVFGGAAYQGNTGVHRSYNGGATWNWNSNGPGSNRNVKSLVVSPAYAADHTLFAGLYGEGVYKSTDSGLSWSAANAGINTLSALSLVISPAFATDQTIFVATTDGVYSGGGPYYHVWKSVNGGSSWSLADNGVSGAIDSLAVSPAFSSDQTLYAATSTGTYKTTDGGNSWTRVHTAASGSSVVVISPAYASDQTVLVSVYGDNVYRSTTGGGSWSPSASSFPVGRKQLTALTLSPAFAGDRTVFAATSLAGPYIVVSPLTNSFGSVKVNTTSATRQVTITNGSGPFGDANLAISSMNFSGSQFSLAPGTCGTLTPTLTPGSSCSVDISFSPTFSGNSLGSILINHNDGQHSTQYVELSGSGISAWSNITSPVTGTFSNASSQTVSGVAGCSGGCTVSLVEISIDGGTTWQAATGTSSWSRSFSVPDGAYTIRSRATSNLGIVETPGSGISVTVDRQAPTGTLALYNGVWTLNANARDGQACIMVYPLICGTLEMYVNNSWQPAATTPGTGGTIWLRDRAGNISIINGTNWNDQGGPIYVGGMYPYYSYLQHAVDDAGDGTVLKLKAAQFNESLLAAKNASYAIRGGYNSSHSAITGTTQLSGILTVQAGTLSMENLAVTGSMTVEGGAVTASALSIQ